MPDPIPFTAVTPRLALPLLFAGQAQKEFFVNEALARVDALLHPLVEETTSIPPADPAAGQSWLVGSDPTGAFEGQMDAIAVYDGASFVFASPAEGAIVRCRTGGSRVYSGGSWTTPASPQEPTGGSVVDVEARGAIATLLEALRLLGAIS